MAGEVATAAFEGRCLRIHVLAASKAEVWKRKDYTCSEADTRVGTVLFPQALIGHVFGAIQKRVSSAVPLAMLL
jgi:hypothetical protein